MTETLTPDQILVQTLAQQFTTQQLVETYLSVPPYSSGSPKNQQAAQKVDELAAENPLLRALVTQTGLYESINNPARRLELFDKYHDVVFSIHTPSAIVSAAIEQSPNNVSDLYKQAAQYGATEILEEIDKQNQERIALENTSMVSDHSRRLAMFSALLNEQNEAIYYLTGQMDVDALRQEKFMTAGSSINAEEENILSQEMINERLDAAINAHNANTAATALELGKAVTLEAEMMASGVEGITVDGEIKQDEIAALKNKLCGQGVTNTSNEKLSIEELTNGVEALKNGEESDICRAH